ncbi:MAG: tetratricopeptide repeat protein [Myxococcota bacterium]
MLVLSLCALLAFEPARDDRSRAIERVEWAKKLESRGHTAGAIRALREAIAYDYSYATAHYVMGQVLRNEGRLQDARMAFESAAQEAGADDPLGIEVAFQLAAVFSALSDAPGQTFADRGELKKTAIQRLDEVLRRDASRYRALARRAQLHRWFDDPTAANADLRRCVELKPSYSPCLVELAQLYVDYGFVDEATAVLDVGLAFNENDAIMFAGAGKVHLEAGHPVTALELFKGAAELDPDLMEARFGLGMTHARLNHRAEAVEHLQAFLARVGNDGPESERRAATMTIARMQDVI